MLQNKLTKTRRYRKRLSLSYVFVDGVSFFHVLDYIVSDYHIVVLFHRVEFRLFTCFVFESIRFDGKESKQPKIKGKCRLVVASNLCVFRLPIMCICVVKLLVYEIVTCLKFLKGYKQSL